MKIKDPCLMTLEEAQRDVVYWSALFRKGRLQAHGRDVETRLEALQDRIALLLVK